MLVFQKSRLAQLLVQLATDWPVEIGRAALVAKAARVFLFAVNQPQGLPFGAQSPDNVGGCFFWFSFASWHRLSSIGYSCEVDSVAGHIASWLDASVVETSLFS
jgi:hypothetical protein